MTLGTFLQAIISIAFLYLILAIFTSELQEYLATIFESRAKRLKQSIRQMLGEQDWPFYQIDSDGLTIKNGSKIYIKDGKIGEAGEAIEDPSNLGNFYIKGDAVTKYSVVPDGSNPQVFTWTKDATPIQVKDVTNLTSDQTAIWIKDNDDTEVKEDQIIQEAPNTPTTTTPTTVVVTGYIKGDAVTKYPVQVDINPNSIYWWDIINTKIIDDKNKLIATLENFQVDSLTEKLYQHRNIRALNQSSFGWWSLLRNPIILLYFIFAVLCIVQSGYFLSSNQSRNFIYSLAVFILATLVYILYYVKWEDKSKSGKIRVEDKLGKMRKSVGPSDIDADIFARTLVDVIKLYSNHTDKQNIEECLKSIKFYTPAQSILQEMFETVKSNLASGGTDESSSASDETVKKQIIGELTKKYKEGFLKVQDRSTGVYKRNSKGLSFLIGLLIAIMFNADTFNMISSLTKENNNAGNQLVTKLEEQSGDLFNCPVDGNQTDCFDKDKQEKLKEIFNSIDTLPLGWKINQIDQNVANITKSTGIITKLSKSECETTDDKSCFEAIEKLLTTSGDNTSEIVASLTGELKDSIKNVRNSATGEIDDSKLPAFKEQYTNFINQKKRENISSILELKDNPMELTKQIKTTVEKQGGWFKVLFGWLITAIAIAMGAPFWFDLLSRVMNVGKPFKSASTETQPETETLMVTAEVKTK
jgi:hypothetical protein